MQEELGQQYACCFVSWLEVHYIYEMHAAVIQIQNLAYENLFFKFSWKLKFIHKLLGIHILIIKLSPTFFLPVQKVIGCLDFNWNSWASQI